ncbi:MAG: TonB-dependent receptor [Pseudomonadota bacterium]
MRNACFVADRSGVSAPLRVATATCATLTTLLYTQYAFGQANIADQTQPEQTCTERGCVITYEASFFARYKPVTALDMLRNVPGFQIQDGGESRGFGGAAGNVLINSERQATKSESTSDILGRLPANAVRQIIIIRGQTGGLDVRGQSVVANVIVDTNAGSPFTWSASSVYNASAPGFFPTGAISYSKQKGGLSYTLGIEGERYQRLFQGPEELITGAGAIAENRDEIFQEDGWRGQTSFNGQYKQGRTAVRLNASVGFFDEAGGETSVRVPTNGDPSVFFVQPDEDEEFSLEVGGDIERSFDNKITAKIIGLYTRTDFREDAGLDIGPTPDTLFRQTETLRERLSTETIARLEVDYAGIKGHLLEFSAEGAINRLESEFGLLQDADDGLGLVRQDVPGANTTVTETRGDFSISDSFRVGPIAVDAILAAEASTIEQVGDFQEERSFFFWAPNLTLTWTPSETTQLRLRGLRSIAQLDFGDFVSSTDLGDIELQLGNPELAPETTWTVDFSVERRFGAIGILSLTAFHDWISDVQDVLPLGGVLETPGNIGDGFRAGIRGEGAMPLDWLGVKNGRLDFSGEYQFSGVTDPVTGSERRLSNERGFEYSVAFRQDFIEQRWAWGSDIFVSDRFFLFNLDELEERVDRPDWDAFIETTRLANLRIRLTAQNILNTGPSRDRAVFVGQRGFAPVLFSEVRERNTGRTFELSVEGRF